MLMKIISGCRLLVKLAILIVGFAALYVSTTVAGDKESEFACQGYNTIIHSTKTKLIAVCHGAYADFNRKEIGQWQDCYDSVIYTKDKKTSKNTVIADCSPTRYIQLRVHGGALDIKYYYDPYSSDEQKPFVLKSYDVSYSSSAYKILADLGRPTRKEVGKTVQLMNTEINKPFDGRTYFNAIYSGFDMIRAFAQVDPDFSMKVLNSYIERQVFYGEVSERLSQTIDDVQLIMSAKKTQKSGEDNKVQ